MKQSIRVALLVLTPVFCLAQGHNMVLEANWDDDSLPHSGGLTYNDCWGYNASNGTEVAIMGSLQRVYFFNVTNPSNPQIIDYFPVLNQNGTTNNSIWRDFKTYGHYAYASADQGTSGLLIFDLSYVPDSVVLVTQTHAFFQRSHNIWIDVANARLYAAGSNTNSNGLIVLDLTDPVNPVQIGSPTLPLGYVHDVHVVDHIAYASHGTDQALAIFDFTTATSPILLKTLDGYPEPGYNHSSWLNADGTKLVFADETHGRGLKLVNPNLSDHQTTNYKVFRSNLLQNNNNSIAHNPFIKNELCYVAYYHDGVQVFDISDTSNIVRVAYYDTYENTTYTGFEGCWGVYPYLQSGRIIASDISNGLFILSLTEGVLPLSFVAFDAVKERTDALLKWSVANPEEGEVMWIEHSRDGQFFETLGQMHVDRTVLNYQHRHMSPAPGIHYYRITVRHLDGKTTSTPVRSLQWDLDRTLVIRSTLVRDFLEVDAMANLQLSIVAMDGKEYMRRQISGPGRTTLDLSALPPGQYHVTWLHGNSVQTQVITRL